MNTQRETSNITDKFRELAYLIFDIPDIEDSRLKLQYAQWILTNKYTKKMKKEKLDK